MVIYLLNVLILCTVFIQPPQNQSACEGGSVNFTCVIMFPNGSTPGGANWINAMTGGRAIDVDGHSYSNDVNGCDGPANVTNVLTVTNVSIGDDGRGYVCAFGFGMNALDSNISFLTVLGTCVSL